MTVHQIRCHLQPVKGALGQWVSGESCVQYSIIAQCVGRMDIQHSDMLKAWRCPHLSDALYARSSLSKLKCIKSGPCSWKYLAFVHLHRILPYVPKQVCKGLVTDGWNASEDETKHLRQWQNWVQQLSMNFSHTAVFIMSAKHINIKFLAVFPPLDYTTVLLSSDGHRWTSALKS